MPHPLSVLLRIGPAIVVAAVVLGPGSIVTASRLGCEFGYQMLWVLPMATALMVSMTVTAMTIGVIQRQTPCAAVAESFGRFAAFLVGVAMLIAVTMFQASNNNALLMAAEGFAQTEPAETPAGSDANPKPDTADSAPTVVSIVSRTAIPLAFNLLVIGMLWASRRDLYRIIERAMAWLVGAMVIAFATNLVFAAPSPAGVLAGLLPSLPAGDNDAAGTMASSWVTVGAMIATTFSVAGAFYQSYQVREKGWTKSELRLGLVDSLVGICALGLITIMILVTAAAALHGVVPAAELTDAAAVARALDPLFGSAAQYVFAAGVLAGAVSSFVVNALIGAVVFCDAIGKSTRLSDPPVRRTTAVVLLLGWIVSAFGVITNTPLAEFIVVAQSLTVIAFPVLAVTILWQAHRLPPGTLPRWVMPLNYAGLLVTVLLSLRTLWRLTGA